MIDFFWGISILRYWFRVIGKTDTQLLEVVWGASAQSGSGGQKWPKMAQNTKI